MKTLRWVWPILMIVLILALSWAIYVFQPSRPLAIVVVDKTVPFETRVEHRSFFWLLNYLKVVRPDMKPYDLKRDYFGAFPGKVAGDPPEKITDLPVSAARQADLVYLADTYGVYSDDLRSKSDMKAALERSHRICGGLELEEVTAVEEAVMAGNTVIAEFNTLGSPTASEPRHRLESLLGVKWSEWIGRFFPMLEDTGEVPEWVRRDYEREWKRKWELTGPGYVLLQDDAHCEVLLVGAATERVGLTIEKTEPVAPVLKEARDHTAYPYWFDILTPQPGTHVIATFRWHLTAAGRERLRERGLPEEFPAVTTRTSGRGTAYYFAGDFADNPMHDSAVPLAGYLTLRRWIEGGRIGASKQAFYWRFYAPMIEELLAELPRNTRQPS